MEIRQNYSASAESREVAKMGEKEKKVCRIKVVGSDKEGRPIIEIGGDKKECMDVFSILTKKKELVLRFEEEKEST